MLFFKKTALVVSCREGDPQTLVVTGSLTGKNSELLKRQCPATGPFRLDLGGVKAVDGRGIAALADLGTRPQVTLASPPRCVRLPLEKTRLFQVLDIEG